MTERPVRGREDAGGARAIKVPRPRFASTRTKFLALTALALAASVIAGVGAIAQLKFNAFLSDSVAERLDVVATTSAEDFGAATDLGLPLEAIANADAILQRAQRHDPSITSIYVIDVNGELTHRSGDGTPDSSTLDSFELARDGITDSTWEAEGDGVFRRGALITGSFGQSLGAVVVEYPTNEMDTQRSAIRRWLISRGAMVAAALAAMLVAVGVIWTSRPRGRGGGAERDFQLTAGAMSVLLLVGVAFFGLMVVKEFNRALSPELERRATLIGETIVDDTERAVAVGIPPDRLVGMEEYLDRFVDQFEEAEQISVQFEATRYDSTGFQPAASGPQPHSFAISNGEARIGDVTVSVDEDFVNSRLRGLALDVLVILVVIIVIAFEAARMLSRQIAGDRADAVDNAADPVIAVRVLLFTFVVGDELSKSFLPLFIRAADQPFGALDPAVAVSLPIAAYLLTMAIASPAAGQWMRTVGPRRWFVIGVVPSASSHLGMVLVDDVVSISLLRALSGVGYAIVTIAALEYLLDRSDERQRGRGIAAFVAVVIGGTFVGTALGGILANRLGYDTVFVISAATVTTAGLVSLIAMRPGRHNMSTSASRYSASQLLIVARQTPVRRLLTEITVPMNVLMAAFLWYLVPLLLADLGESASAIARTLMTYYLAIMLLGPLAMWLRNRLLADELIVGIGGAVAGASLLGLALNPSSAAVIVAVFGVGVGHAMIRGPQIEIALRIADRDLQEFGREPVLAVMRSLERLGAVAGLLLMALISARWGQRAALVVVGTATLVAGLGYGARSPARVRGNHVT